MKTRTLTICLASLAFVTLSQLSGCAAQLSPRATEVNVEDLHAKYEELCAIWRKTDGQQNMKLSAPDIALVRYWLNHQPDIWFGQDFTRMAAVTAGNVHDQEACETLEKLYLDTRRYEMVRAEAFLALAKIDPPRAAQYVITELSSGNSVFAIYADIALKDSYNTSFEVMKSNMTKAYKRSHYP